MKKVVIGIAVTVCVMLWASVIFAADKQEGSFRFEPSLSVGYANVGDPNIKFQTKGTPLSGIGGIRLQTPNSGVYVGVALPFALTDRMALTIDGRWTFLSMGGGAKEDYFNAAGIFAANREWETDRHDWVTLDLLLSYAFIKNFSFVKDVSAVAGFRWDYQNMELKNPLAAGIVTVPLDKVDFTMNTFAPVLGITSTLKFFKYGIFGGDVKLGVSGSPYLFGNVDYRETFAKAAAFDFDHSLDHSWFVTLSGEMDLLSVRIARGVLAKLSTTAQYSWFNIRKTGTMDFLGTVFGAPDARKFEFTYSPQLFTVGGKFSVLF